MMEAEVKRVAITLVGDSNPRDVEYGGVVELPEGHTVDDVETLYGEWRRSESRCSFTDWLLKRGFKEDHPVGYVILFAEDYPGDSVTGDVAADEGGGPTEVLDKSKAKTGGQADVAESAEYLYVFCCDSVEVRKLTRRTERSIYGDSKRYSLDRLHVTVFDDREEAINDYVEWISAYEFTIPEDAKDLIRRLVRADLMTKEAEVDAEEQLLGGLRHRK